MAVWGGNHDRQYGCHEQEASDRMAPEDRQILSNIEDLSIFTTNTVFVFI